MKYLVPVSLMVAALFTLALPGCGSSSTKPTGSSTPAAVSNSGSHDQGSHAHQGEGKTDMEKMKAEMAKLSPEDAASAEKQHICPVAGKMLGTMGAPIKVNVDGQQVWICCTNCKKKLLDNPEKYLAKLKKE